MASGKFAGANGAALNNQDYWIARSEEIEAISHKKALKLEKQMDKLYKETIAELQTKIDAFLLRYATEHKISLLEAEKVLAGIDLIDYRNRMNSLLRQYKTTKSAFALADIEKLTSRGQITRLQGLIDELTVQLGMFSHNAQIAIEETLSEVYEEAYYRTIYSIESGTVAGISFAKVNQEAIKQVLAYKWSGDMFSSRIWRNRDSLVLALKDELTRGLVQGTSTQVMAKNLKDKLNNTSYNATRIIRTETNFVLGQATAKGYEEVGLEQYQFLATLDNRTSNTCGKLDGKVFNLADKQVGVNFPPLHPHCRSTCIPYFNKKVTDEVRIAREDRENNYVPSSLNYEEWKELKGI